jgi:HSP20 family protein
MNLVKRVLRRGNEQGRKDTALSKLGLGRMLGRNERPGFGAPFGELWRDFDRDPWSAFDRMDRELGAMTAWPAMDVSEDENAVTVCCDVPGLEAKDLDVQVSGQLLTISGSRQDEWSEKKRGARRQERVSGSFSRSITLPSYVDGTKVQAKYDKGTLTITIAKVPGKGPRRVKVEAG